MAAISRRYCHERGLAPQRVPAAGCGWSVIDFTQARVGQTLHLPCCRGHTVDFYIKSRMPPDQVAKRLMRDGWTIGNKLTCPKHGRKARVAASTSLSSGVQLPDDVPRPDFDPIIIPKIGASTFDAEPSPFAEALAAAIEKPSPRKRKPPTVPPSKIRAKIVGCLADFSDLTHAEIGDLIMHKANSVQWAMRALREEGTVVRTGAGTTAEPHRYNLASRQPAPAQEETPMPSITAASPAPTPSQSDAARTAKRLAIMALEDSFNAGRYKPGTSDDSIASESGLSVSAVKLLREEFFGPLKTPSEIEVVIAQIDALKVALATLEQETLEKTRDIRTSVATLNARVETIAKRNGWI